MKALWRWIVATTAAFGALILVVTFTPFVPWCAHRLAGSFDDPRGDVLILLGAARSDTMLSYSSYLRSAYAIRAYREGWVRTIVVSGDAAVDRNGANPIRDFLVANGVSPSIIQLESASVSTHEGAVFTKRLLDGLPGKKILLTSDYHMYRAERAFRKAGTDCLSRPFPDAFQRGSSVLLRWPAFLDLCLEMTKIGYYRVRGWI